MKNLAVYFVFPLLTINSFDALGQKFQNEEPNIIFIMTDDQSPMPIDKEKTSQSRPFGFNGDSHVYTPNIDNLANNGIVFTRAYVSSTVCSPSRYSILTGKYAGRCKANRFIRLHPTGTQTRVENNTELEEKGMNVARLLKDVGYKTGFVGKCHVIDHNLLRRKNWGKSSLMIYKKEADPRSPEVAKAMKHNHNYWVNRIKEFGFDYANSVYAANLRELYNDSLNVHNVEWNTKAVLDFIEKTGDEPFFLYYSETIPHGPAPWIKRHGQYLYGLDANPKFTGEGFVDEDYSFMPSREEIKSEVKKMQGKDPDHAWLRWFDQAIGSIIEKLKKKGKFQNTLIVITSDHGNYNFGKSTLYESGVRVPLLMYWPAVIERGRVYNELVQNIDFTPTFLDLAGVIQKSSMQLDGVSLKKVLEGSQEPVHDHLFFEIGYARGVATKNWKYITLCYDDKTKEKIKNGVKFRGWKDRDLNQPYYIRNSHLGYHATLHHSHYFAKNQLFNLKKDPEEENNTFDSNPQKAREMKNKLIRILQTFSERPYGNLVK